MFKKLLTAFVLCVGMHSANALIPNFSEADWSRIPVITSFNGDAFYRAIVGKIPMASQYGSYHVLDYDANNIYTSVERVYEVRSEDHKWTVDRFNDKDEHNIDDIRAIIAEGESFKVILIEEGFAHQPFTVDSKGVLERNIVLVSNTQKDSDGRLKEVRVPIRTQLTPEELNNPIIKAIQSDMTFEEAEELKRTDIEKYNKTVGKRNAIHSLLFAALENRVKQAIQIAISQNVSASVIFKDIIQTIDPEHITLDHIKLSIFLAIETGTDLLTIYNAIMKNIPSEELTNNDMDQYRDINVPLRENIFSLMQLARGKNVHKSVIFNAIINTIDSNNINKTDIEALVGIIDDAVDSTIITDAIIQTINKTDIDTVVKIIDDAVDSTIITNAIIQNIK